jgi:ankyrin repeat protein
MRAVPTRLSLALLVLALPAGEALAQQSNIRGGQLPQQQAPAPALPGLAARRAPAPIAPEAGANLGPNAALFDAISRGDLGAAREAMARGANLEARNQLGLTPIDAAVDQGRNDIAFYLLSARDLSRVGAAPEPSPAPGGLAGPPATPAVRSPARREAPAALAAAAAPPAAPAAPRTARLWAGDGGAPRPEIGFLGFDAGRPAGAEPPTAAVPAARRPGRG